MRKTVALIPKIPACPFQLGQRVQFAESDPSKIAHAVIAGLIWDPGHWAESKWVAIVRCYELPESPWLSLPCDQEVPCSDLILQ